MTTNYKCISKATVLNKMCRIITSIPISSKVPWQDTRHFPSLISLNPALTRRRTSMICPFEPVQNPSQPLKTLLKPVISQTKPALNLSNKNDRVGLVMVQALCVMVPCTYACVCSVHNIREHYQKNP